MSVWLGRAAVGLLILCLVWAYRSILDLSLVPRMTQEPWLINQGFAVYRDIVDQHEAGLPMLLALALPLVGSPLLLVKWTFIALVAMTILLTYLVAKRASGEMAGVLAALYLALWLPLVFGGKLWYEVAIGPLCLLAIVLWSGEPTAGRRRILAAGLALGVAATVKQYAWALVATYIIVLGWLALMEAAARRRRLETLAYFALGVSLPYASYLLFIAASGAFGEYVYWAWLNNLSRYRGQAALAPRPDYWQTLAAIFLPVVVPLVLALGQLRRREIPQAGVNLLLLGLTAAAATPAYPRFEFFHLAAALPLASVAFGSGAVRGLRAAVRMLWRNGRVDGELPSRRLQVLAVLLVVASLLWAGHSLRLLVPSYGSLLQPPQRLLTYAELIPVADWVARSTDPAEPILVFPDDELTSHTYLLSGRLPPGIWAYTYPWYMTDEVIAETIKAMELRGVRAVVYFEGRGVDGRPATEYAATLASYIEREYRRVASLNWEHGVVHLLFKRQ